ncbi:MAG: SDR family oxidoreductase [Synergistaceae bacterium]|jgi:NAD(P)-dependent dehydrogenase (short-subunit alcohol dehydrogenase family)|nr:SDR family oxidoreductase [Synergistaceae bacterium]
MNGRTAQTLENLFSLEGAVGIVTGASSGIGLGIAAVLADAGAKVYGINRNPHEEPGFEGIVLIQGDVTDTGDMKAIVTEIALKEGKLDFLVNNAGITRRQRAEEVDAAFWEQIHQINVDAVFYLSQICYPYLSKSERIGRIVNIASMASYMGFSEVVPYCSTKSAVQGITRGLATEWANDNLLVNSVSPGWFPSKMNRQVMDEKRKEKILSKIALGRFGDTRDIGSMVLYLLSSAATYITGQDFAVDGGALSFGF